MLNYNLKTKYTDLLDKNNPLSEYPRPSFKRNAFKSLNGMWEYSIKESDNQIFNPDGEILVPFCLESALSGVCRELNSNETLIYRKTVSFDDVISYDHIILHFDSVMQVSELYINGQFILKNTNGFLPFEKDIKEYITEGNNEIILKVENKPDYTFSTGKENVKRGGMWYTKTSGIYKPVWYEWYNDGYIKDVIINADTSGHVSGKIISDSESNVISVIYSGEIIKSFECKNDFDFVVDSPELWSPESPALYYLKVENKCECIDTYFAFRKFICSNGKFYLNGNEYFINGLLDQGYFSDGIYTPSNNEAFADDIKLAKELGFNTLRKHIKVESDIFYYYADKLGILILQDFPNIGKYNFVTDSLLPLIKIKIKPNKTSSVAIENFDNQGYRIIDMMKKHPSVVYFTIFNEGWGEFDARTEYRKFKSYAPEYVFDTAYGWFERKESDVLSIHNYFFKLKVPKSNRPVIISEYGGYNCKVQGHIFNDTGDYGYHKCKDISVLNEDLKKLFFEIEQLKNKGLAGAIYTQLSDVEDETNGLVTYDREVVKYLN